MSWALAIGLGAATLAAQTMTAHPLRTDSLSAVTVSPPPHAALPPSLRFKDGLGVPQAVSEGAGGVPRVVVFADYACSTLCGPALAIVGARLSETGLVAGRDYRLRVIGLDPASTPLQASRFGEDRLPEEVHGQMLTGDASSIAAAAAALGYRYAFDPTTRTFAHPVAAFVLTSDGRLTRVLSEVALTTTALKAALVQARRGAAPGLVETIAIACHGALQATGVFDAPILFALRLGGGATVMLGAGALFLLARRRRENSA